MRIAFVSFGCKVNQAETDSFIASLSEYDAEYSPKAEDADIVVVNTCAVTQKAQTDGEKYLKSLRLRRPGIKIAATGCLAELVKDNLKTSGVDIVVSNNDKKGLISLLNLTKKDGLFSRSYHKTRAFLKVQDGCDSFCTYCIIPSLRGRPVSKPLAEVIAEAADLAAKGYKEIVVTGIHIGLYGVDIGSSLTKLLSELTTIPADFRIRLTSLDVNEINRELVSLIKATGSKICPHFHISLQSGSAKVLSLMGRKYTPADFQNSVTLIRKNIDNACIGIDLIAGFPGETEELFSETLSLLNNTDINYIHAFPYSKRPGTPAATAPKQNPDNVKNARAKTVRLLGGKLKQKSMQEMTGRTVIVLAEKDGKGHTENFYLVHLPESCEVNCFYKLKITASANGILLGELIDE